MVMFYQGYAVIQTPTIDEVSFEYITEFDGKRVLRKRRQYENSINNQ